jgi:hypothetical protein
MVPEPSRTGTGIGSPPYRGEPYPEPEPVMVTSSRVPGRGRLLFSLRALLQRTEKFMQLRATPSEQPWAARLHDELSATFAAAVSSQGSRAALEMVDRRRAVSRKTRPTVPMQSVIAAAEQEIHHAPHHHHDQHAASESRRVRTQRPSDHVSQTASEVIAMTQGGLRFAERGERTDLGSLAYEMAKNGISQKMQFLKLFPAQRLKVKDRRAHDVGL